MKTQKTNTAMRELATAEIKLVNGASGALGGAPGALPQPINGGGPLPVGPLPTG